MDRKIVLEKSKRILTVYVGKKPVKRYFAAIGPVQLEPKTRRNDCKTPEGLYYICSKNPRSRYELSLLISYPSTKDAENGLMNGLVDQTIVDLVREAIEHKRTPPQETVLGSAICIHGGGIGEVSEDLKMARICDWTQGCIALRREDMIEIFDFAEPGITVEIQP
jgi:murein L,D-transpeptidase YafK